MPIITIRNCSILPFQFLVFVSDFRFLFFLWGACVACGLSWSAFARRIFCSALGRNCALVFWFFLKFSERFWQKIGERGDGLPQFALSIIIRYFRYILSFAHHKIARYKISLSFLRIQILVLLLCQSLSMPGLLFSFWTVQWFKNLADRECSFNFTYWAYCYELHLMFFLKI